MDTRLQLQELAQGFAMVAIGKDFFRLLAQHLSKALEVDYVFIGELARAEDPNGQFLTIHEQTIRSILFWAHGEVIQDVQYPLVGSLCEYVVKEGVCAFPANVQQLFPHNQALKHFKVDSYVGVSLYNSSGHVAGLIYIMHTRPIEDISRTAALLKIVARRAELELDREQRERQLSEKNQQLQQTQAQLVELNEQLERRVGQRTEELQIANEQIKELLKREKAARIEADEGRKLVENLFMQAPVAIGIFRGAEFVVELANEALCNIWGCTKEEVLGKPMFEVFPQFIEQGFKERLTKVFNSGTTSIYNEIAVHIVREGKPELVYLKVVHQATRNPNGEITGVIIAATVVTNEVIARKQVEESEARALYLLDSMPQIAWTSQPDSYSINFFNKRWFDYTGLSKEQSLDLGWQQIVHPEDLPVVQEARAKSRKDGKAYEVENRYLRASDGTYRWHLSRVVPVLNDNNNIVLWVGTATDIQEQKIAQQKLEQTLSELHAKNFELDQFVYKTSHDLRAPLTSILGLINISKLEQDEITKMHYTDLIENRVHKLDNFIRSMLDYSRNTRTVRVVEQIDFKALLAECLTELAYMKNFIRVEVTMAVAGEVFYSDKFRLKIIFSNLISNAIKYQDLTKEQSKLNITIDVTQKQASLQFVDNGLGIEQPYLEKIFNMFFRATHQADGSGLGLYIVKQTVDVLQGSIQVESQIGQGTRFIIILSNPHPAEQ